MADLATQEQRVATFWNSAILPWARKWTNETDLYNLLQKHTDWKSRNCFSLKPFHFAILSIFFSKYLLFHALNPFKTTFCTLLLSISEHARFFLFLATRTSYHCDETAKQKLLTCVSDGRRRDAVRSCEERNDNSMFIRRTAKCTIKREITTYFRCHLTEQDWKGVHWHSEVFITPHHAGRCCTSAITGHCCVTGHSCTNVITGHCYATMGSNNGNRWVALLRNATDMDGPKECSSLTLEREECLKSAGKLISQSIVTNRNGIFYFAPLVLLEIKRP
jgi:hypothetical protein